MKLKIKDYIYIAAARNSEASSVSLIKEAMGSD